MRKQVGATVFGVLMLATIGCVTTPVEGRVYVRTAPPPRPIERRVIAPGPEYIWQPGYHVWNGRGYIWVPGHWEPAPRPRARWVEPHWERSRKHGWYFVEGHWR